MAHPYDKGLHEVGSGVYAYLQPDGSWGWSNAGLITDGGASLLVDTLFDLRLTSEMLRAMSRATRAAESIDVVVNTHANGDHCFGNQLVQGAEIIASHRGAQEMSELPPSSIAKLTKVAEVTSRLGRPGYWLTQLLGRAGLERIGALGRAASFVNDIFGDFDFDGIELVLPTRTFDGELELEVGDKRVRLIEVGPAHTQGDVLVYLPDDRVVFTGDILFVGGHPIVWAGPVSNWVKACDRILEMDAEVVVPGHGPITDEAGVRGVRDYLVHLDREARARFHAGMSLDDAVADIGMEEFSSLGEAERLVVNVDTVYRELRGDDSPRDTVELFARMATFRRSGVVTA